MDLSVRLTCQPLLQETMVQDLEDMKVSVRGQHHAQLQEACAGQNIPFSFNLGYLILGMCYLLCDLTFCKVFYSIYCVSLGHEIQWICQLDKVFSGAFTTVGCF